MAPGKDPGVQIFFFNSPNFGDEWGSYLVSIIIRFVFRVFASPSLAYTCLDLPTKIAYPVFHDFSSPPTCLHVPRLAYKDRIPCIPSCRVAATCLHLPRLAYKDCIQRLHTQIAYKDCRLRLHTHTAD